MRMLAVRRPSRGSALVTVILVILILTIVGLGVAYFAQIEEGLSGNARLTRAAFYVAEVGLRKGESVIGNSIVGVGIGLSTILSCGGCSAPLNVPGGGWQGIILHAADPEDSVTKDFVNQTVPVPGTVVDRGSFSLYVRNNPDDPSGLETVDSDNVVVLISVGQVQGVGGRTFTRILEEQLLTGALGASIGGQYLTNAGGTSSGAKSK